MNKTTGEFCYVAKIVGTQILSVFEHELSIILTWDKERHYEL